MFSRLVYKITIRNIYTFKCKNSRCNEYADYATLKPPWKVLFFGTDDFPLPSLQALTQEYANGGLCKLEVVTARKEKKNPTEKFSLGKGLVIHDWPVDVSLCKEFDIGLVVSFGHLIPKDIINCFKFGMLNVHASLLPRWRGASPIVHAIANGDNNTGITIMKIKPHHFDIGDIISQSSVKIDYKTTMPELYKDLATLGAQMLLEVIQNLPDILNKSIPQHNEGITFAPKVKTDMSQIKWEEMPARAIYNLARALTSVFYLQTTFQEVPVKFDLITECDTCNDLNPVIPGLIIYEKNVKLLKVQCVDGKWINIAKVGVPGKKMMSAADFNNGYLSKHSKHLRIFR